MGKPFLVIEYRSGIPVYRQIINRISAAISSGEFLTGQQLPTIRRLAADLKINPNTVAKAYRELELTGLIQSAGRNGSVIKATAEGVARLTKSQKESKLKELHSRIMAEARAYQISAEELAAVFKRGVQHG